MSQVSWQERESNGFKKSIGSRNRKTHGDHDGFYASHENISDSQGYVEGKSTSSDSAPSGRFQGPSISTIPLNAGSKLYSMQEVFDVWDTVKDQVLTNGTSNDESKHEAYRATKPAPIYHLELKDENAKFDTSDLAESLKGIQTEDNTKNLPQDTIGQNGNYLDQEVKLASPQQVEWLYIDPSGNEQGPFSGEMMQQWYSEGYLTLDLNIRRQESTEYQTLKEFCEAVYTFDHPFSVPLPDLNYSSQQPSQTQQQLFTPLASDQANVSGNMTSLLSNGQSALGNANSLINSTVPSQPNAFGSDIINNSDPFATSIPPSAASFAIDSMPSNIFNVSAMPSLLQQQIHSQQSGLSTNNTNWGMDSSTNGIIGSRPGTPMSTVPSVPPLVTQQPPLSPWLHQSRSSSPFVQGSAFPNGTVAGRNQSTGSDGDNGDQGFNDLGASVITDILNDGDDDLAPPEPVIEKETKVIDENHQPEQAQLDLRKESTSPSSHVSPNLTSKKAPEKSTSPEKKNNGSSKIKKIESAKQPSPSPLSKPVLAPWASSATNTSSSDSGAPAVTLKEIQKMEAEKVERQKRLQAESKTETPPLWVEEKSSEKISLPSSWASNNGSAPVTKTSLADIQREEAEAAAKAKTKPKSSSFASAVANSGAKDDGTWTTVATKKTSATAKKPVPTITNTNSWASKSTPQTYRSASVATPTVSGVNPIALKEDFLLWARDAMTNLYPTVSKEDLLEIFTTLPVNSSDSSQLIAETIYSSSANIDGRRFAQEFLKRRMAVEKQTGSNDGSGWHSAIISSAGKVKKVDDEGWCTSIKGKKKRN